MRSVVFSGVTILVWLVPIVVAAQEVAPPASNDAAAAPHARASLSDVCMSRAGRGAAWFVIACTVLESIVFLGLAQSVSKRCRGFHLLAYSLMLLPAIAFVTLVSGFGMSEFGAPFGDRCFFTARWLMLLVELPLLVTAVGLLAGVATMDLAVVAIQAFVMVMAGMLGGVTDGNNRWIFFIIAGLAALPILRVLWTRWNMYDADDARYEHEYSSIVANRTNFLCKSLLLYVVTIVLFWVLCQGAAVMSAPVELLILSIVDVVFISAFCISLLSDRETVEKMGEYNSRIMGWKSAGGANEYASIEERSTGIRS